MRAIATALVMLAAIAAAGAELNEREIKIIRCRHAATDLIGLDHAALKARCGLWTHANRTVTAAGETEQLVFDPYLYVYTRNGIVTAVQAR